MCRLNLALRLHFFDFRPHSGIVLGDAFMLEQFQHLGHLAGPLHQRLGKDWRAVSVVNCLRAIEVRNERRGLRADKGCGALSQLQALDRVGRLLCRAVGGPPGLLGPSFETLAYFVGEITAAVSAEVESLSLAVGALELWSLPPSAAPHMEGGSDSPFSRSVSPYSSAMNVYSSV